MHTHHSSQRLVLLRILILGLLFAGLVAVTVLARRSADNRQRASTGQGTASLAFSPADPYVQPGSTQSLALQVNNLHSSLVDGFQVVLNITGTVPANMEFAAASISGMHTAVNTFSDTAEGKKLEIAYITNDPSAPFNPGEGSVTLGNFTYVAPASGQVTLAFDNSRSKVVQHTTGNDILGMPSTFYYNFTTSTPTPTPGATPVETELPVPTPTATSCPKLTCPVPPIGCRMEGAGGCSCGTIVCSTSAPTTTPKPDSCVRTGCAGELCVDAATASKMGMVTSCNYQPKYACFAYTKCERQATGRCDWTPNTAYEQCLKNPPTATPYPNISCNLTTNPPRLCPTGYSCIPLTMLPGSSGVCLPTKPAPSSSPRPSLPPGCRYVVGQCFQAPCDLSFVCASPTPTPNPTPIGCNGSCRLGVNVPQCGVGLTCYSVTGGTPTTGGTGVCRNPSNLTDTSCRNATPTPSPRPSLPPGCVYVVAQCFKAPCDITFKCATPTPTPRPTATPRPSLPPGCWYKTTSCVGTTCSVTVVCPTPTPTPRPTAPPGCRYQTVQCFKAPCPSILVCSTPVPATPRPSATPLACNAACDASTDCGPGMICYQPPMPTCPPGATCPQLMPARLSCRNAACKTSPNCLCGSPTPTIAPTPQLHLAGDINNDNKVDIFDFNLLIGQFGKSGAGLSADINGDGKVDIFDFNLLVSNFGKHI